MLPSLSSTTDPCLSPVAAAAAAAAAASAFRFRFFCGAVTSAVAGGGTGIEGTSIFDGVDGGGGKGGGSAALAAARAAAAAAAAAAAFFFFFFGVVVVVAFAATAEDVWNEDLGSGGPTATAGSSVPLRPGTGDLLFFSGLGLREPVLGPAASTAESMGLPEPELEFIFAIAARELFRPARHLSRCMAYRDESTFSLPQLEHP